ncbi:MAG: hypothetical protein E6Q97_17765 [Desulfurellales bacterium]|nr:MAG: hypothetical protein E6Q97_17765 [Desulfurellales bacterium]
MTVDYRLDESRRAFSSGANGFALELTTDARGEAKPGFNPAGAPAGWIRRGRDFQFSGILPAQMHSGEAAHIRATLTASGGRTSFASGSPERLRCQWRSNGSTRPGKICLLAGLLTTKEEVRVLM